eukprot:14561972-Heterocapsa_arctica.AAC.1
MVHNRIAGALQPGHGKLEPRWSDGVWLGKRYESDEHLIGTADGVVKCRAIAQKPTKPRWNKQAISQLKGVPWAWAGE